MNFIYLDYKSYIDLINAKNEVILGVVNENSEDSKLFVGVLAQLSKKYCLNDVYLIKRSIYKEINKDRTVTNIRQISLDERIAELAKMISSKVDEASIQLAKQMIEKF